MKETGHAQKTGRMQRRCGLEGGHMLISVDYCIIDEG